MNGEVKGLSSEEYLDKFEQGVKTGLFTFLLVKGESGEVLPETPDIEGKWQEIAKEYLPDGVREFAGYPTVSLGWMMYVGMAVAKVWDDDFDKFQSTENLYLSIREPRGFDCMDEYVREDLLGLVGEGYKSTEKLVGDCATIALRAIQREQFEPGSAYAFHAYVRALHQLYTMGAAVQLKRMGYKMVESNNLN